MYRTHTCGELKKSDVGKTVQLAGWVNTRRDHGGLIFIDLRDRYGITQCTCDPDYSKDAWQAGEKVRPEHVLQIEGEVRERPSEMMNKNLATGEIEVFVKTLTALTKAQTPPFEIEWMPGAKEKKEISEDMRLKYRYLDLRRRQMVRNLTLRYKLISYIREFLNRENFLEIETPILTKSTPEGARDFIVPSRLHPGKFYALPQSPQQYKQLLMVAGIDRYFQIARCFRDEDQRGDRQPEFTQLDLEMSFVERDDILNLTENLFKSVFKRLNEEEQLNKKFVFDKPWRRLSYEEAMLKYGVDRPDLRFALEIREVSKIFKSTNFKIFSEALGRGGVIRAINAKGADLKLTRSAIDGLTEFVRELGGKGLAYIRVRNKELGIRNQGDDGLQSPIAKFLSDDELVSLLKATEAEAGDVIFFGGGERKLVEQTLGALRVKLGDILNLIDPNEFAISWVIDFPLFEETLEEGHFAPSHHMFTAPNPKDLALLDTDPGRVKSLQYDLVINGFEVGGGSIRIHDPEVQKKIFSLIGFSEERKAEFGHMLEAFTYGVPPHGGIAPGIDRIAMLLAGEPNIREVIAFPKNQTAQDLMMSAPSLVEEKQLKEAHIRLSEEKPLSL